MDREKRVFHARTQPKLKPNSLNNNAIPVLRLDKRVTDVRDGQVCLQVLTLLTGLIVAPHYICKNTKHRHLRSFKSALCNF